jgi:hypothetical protein
MNVSDSPFVKELMKALGITALPQVRNNVGSGSSADIVIQQNDERQLVEAICSGQMIPDTLLRVFS